MPRGVTTIGFGFLALVSRARRSAAAGRRWLSLNSAVTVAQPAIRIKFRHTTTSRSVGLIIPSNELVSVLVSVRFAIQCCSLQVPANAHPAKHKWLQRLAGCCISVQQPLIALEGRCSIQLSYGR